MGSMRRATRNDILFWTVAALWFAAAATIIGLAVSFGVRHWVAVTPLAGVLLWIFWTVVRDRRELRRIERSLREDGVDVPEDEPVWVWLAENPESLIAGAVFLLLIAVTLVAYFVGWLRHS